MIQDLIKYINVKNPLFKFYLFLSVFGITSFLDLYISTTNTVERSEYLFLATVTFLSSIVVYYMMRYGFGLTMSNPLNFFVSAWIVFLLIHPTNPLWMVLCAIIAIGIGKAIFKKNNLPIFNPAALALALTYGISIIVSFFSGTDTLLVSWWGADMTQHFLSSIPVVNIIVPIFFLFGFVYFAQSFKKTYYALVFFTVVLLLTSISSYVNGSVIGITALIGATLFNSTAFCAFVMLPEPKTSPIFPMQQIIVGALAGIFLFVSYTWLGAWPVDPMINTILFANGVTLVMKLLPRRPTVSAN